MDKRTVAAPRGESEGRPFPRTQILLELSYF